MMMMMITTPQPWQKYRHHHQLFDRKKWSNGGDTTTSTGIRLHQSAVDDVDASQTTPLSNDDEAGKKFEYALLFDCDGVILETEELHRLAYNEAFRHFNVTILNNHDTTSNSNEPTTTKTTTTTIIQRSPVVWSVDYYDILQNTVGGGKPKMMYYFCTTLNGQFPSYGLTGGGGGGSGGEMNQQPSPPIVITEMEQLKTLIDELQDYKTQYFTTLLETKATARPGVLELMDEALADPTIAVGVCSAATKAAAIQTLSITLGPHRVQQLNVCILGDDVPTKKPDPLIYNTASQRLNVHPSQCVVIEDSLVGLRAAVAANMKCIITYTNSTANQDFYSEGAVATVPDLGSRKVNLQSIFGPLRTNGNDAELLVGCKD